MSVSISWQGYKCTACTVSFLQLTNQRFGIAAANLMVQVLFFKYTYIRREFAETLVKNGKIC